ncbi:MAG: glycoside hydrolase family 3 protein [Acidimicrobiia bacterium]|nr:glycoside hydrolase family 3 protein [Acidimicrobiia bacterium]
MPPPSSTTDLGASRAFASDVLGRMTLAEKIGQMTQAEKNSITPDEVADHGIGSVLSGGGANPEPNTPEAWREMVGAFLDGGRRSRLGIPLLYGVDAVHGHSNVGDATIFPHNVGLGATGDAVLVERVYRATGIETAATGSLWDFAPTVAVSVDPRWGRSYESFGDDPSLVSRLGAAAVRGLQDAGVAACAKHFVGDGGTVWGTAHRVEWTDWWNGWGSQWHIDQGDTVVDEATLRSVHLPPYEDAIGAGVLTVMASYSSWNGDKVHGHHRLLTELLKGELGFEGFVVSDWMGIDQLDADPYRCAVISVNAGIDMVMVPIAWQRFVDDLTRAVEVGDVAIERIDDAVVRILAVKHALGLFDHPAEPPVTAVGAHRDLAREAAAASAVLLDHRGDVLPIGSGRVLVAGAGADDIGRQCGGWTIEWQGGTGTITTGTTILDGLREGGAEVVHDPDGTGDERAPVGVVVVSERPYAEGLGDREDLRLPGEDRELIERIRARVDRLVLVVVAGRPLVLGDAADVCDAIVAAWLPGSEGAGIADVLVGRRPFTGRLPRPWPADAAQVADPGGSWEAAWPRGHGRTI